MDPARADEALPAHSAGSAGPGTQAVEHRGPKSTSESRRILINLVRSAISGTGYPELERRYLGLGRTTGRFSVIRQFAVGRTVPVGSWGILVISPPFPACQWRDKGASMETAGGGRSSTWTTGTGAL